MFLWAVQKSIVEAIWVSICLSILGDLTLIQKRELKLRSPNSRPAQGYKLPAIPDSISALYLLSPEPSKTSYLLNRNFDGPNPSFKMNPPPLFTFYF